MDIIKGRNVIKEYGTKMSKTQVIKGVNLTIKSGEYVSNVGLVEVGKPLYYIY